MTAIHFGLDRTRLDSDLAGLERKLSSLKRAAVPRATAQALNRTADRARTETVRELARVKALPSRFLRRRVTVYRASVKALGASLWIGLKKAIPIEALPGARLVTQGKLAGHLKAGRLAVKVFQATMPSGKRGLYTRKLPSVRRSRGRPVTSSPNLPIDHPSVSLAPEAQDIAARAGARAAREVLPRELRRLFNRELDKLRGA
ncbi:MAG: phage tail protein [Gammaproteobacteria bacterium]|nr:phage tail protein [Gammaproteobacteria bacterium]